MKDWQHFAGGEVQIRAGEWAFFLAKYASCVDKAVMRGDGVSNVVYSSTHFSRGAQEFVPVSD